MALKNPFEIDDDLEESPIAKVPSHAIKTVSQSAAKYTAKQLKAASKAFVSQLYGSGTAGQQQATDDDQHQAVQTNADPVAQVKKQLSTPVYFHPAVQKGQKAQSSSITANLTPTAKTEEEQEKIEQTRKELYHHKQDYYDATLGRMNDLEQDQRKKRHEREQEEQKKKQEEEQLELQKKEEEEKKKQEAVPVATGKGRNRMGMPGAKKAKTNIATQLAQTKTEVNRGSTG